eukprot:TRINITY_DN8062_c0_g1_i4.p1 TRINITY_DN8062_c0_g1~~TRINITY_DN8062_c0_g1_i4.p1  ORF type:complete len:140 (+),score=18.01 TRINITY_DN8062_c0_g1_i4:53-472(+)
MLVCACMQSNGTMLACSMMAQGFSQLPKNTTLPRYAEPFDWVIYRHVRAIFKSNLEKYGLKVPSRLAQEIAEDANEPFAELYERWLGFIAKHRLSLEQVKQLPLNPASRNIYRYEQMVLENRRKESARRRKSKKYEPDA